MEATVRNPEISSSFAGALAAFAVDAMAAEEKHAAPNMDGLADDVATFSYEHVLRVHRRHPAAEPFAEDGASTAPEHPSALPEEKQKSASITLRMSQAECAQLRKRAAAANLTVSAYMRSCILEAETLRAQVKEALAELRAAAPDETSAPARSDAQEQRRWWRPWMYAGSRSVQA
jgi:hypothetical protein